MSRITSRSNSIKPSPYIKQQPITTSNTPTTTQIRLFGKEKWNRYFGGPSYLDPSGPTNRLTLSLRSPIEEEQDWSLSRLVQISSQDPLLLRFSEYPGLLDGLIRIIITFLDEVQQDQAREPWTELGPERKTHLRRALEAALVLRNLSTEPVNLPSLLSAKQRLLEVLVQVLELAETEQMREWEGGAEEGVYELRLSLLEVCESVGGEWTLSLPGSTTSKRQSMSATPRPSPKSALYPLLIPLTQSRDRSLLLSTYRLLSSLSSLTSNELLLSHLVPLPSSSHSVATSHPAESALLLLLLRDQELSLVLLDYLYHQTLLPVNALSILSLPLHPTLIPLFKILVAHFSTSAKIEKVVTSVPMKGSEAEVHHRGRREQPHPKRERTYPELTTKLSEEEMKALLDMEDRHERGLKWMRTIFEPHSTSETTQVYLWTAYRSAFEPHNLTHPMLAAADVIKMSTEAFPTALPQVVDDPNAQGGSGKKFVIKGIRVRDRTDLRTIFRCPVKGCGESVGPKTQLELYHHVQRRHLSSDQTTKCPYPSCPYVAASPTHPVADLSIHIRTHMIEYHPPPGYSLTPDPPEPEDEEAQIVHFRLHALLDDKQEATGIALLAVLVLRNLARVIRKCVEVSGSSGKGGAGAGGKGSIANLTGGESSIFEALTLASSAPPTATANDSNTTTDLMRQLEKPDFTPLLPMRNGTSALLAVQEMVERTVMENFGLGKVLGEVLGVIELGKGVDLSGKKEEKMEL
ncbi:hypothetical protein T439DRAFT_329359 [Meredithblackwellia eburnea MCA 4105]